MNKIVKDIAIAAMARAPISLQPAPEMDMLQNGRFTAMLEAEKARAIELSR